eukprot:6319349-Alexandrium_andersonii.AAC.1
MAGMAQSSELGAGDATCNASGSKCEIMGRACCLGFKAPDGAGSHFRHIGPAGFGLAQKAQLRETSSVFSV